MFFKKPVTRERERDRPRAPHPADIPAEWPNGSGLYRQNTAHRKDDKGLLGRIVRRGNAYAAWQYRAGKYLYLGEFTSRLRASQVIGGV